MMLFILQCKASRLFLADMTPCRAAIEITAAESVALRYDGKAAADAAVQSLRGLFGSFDFRPVAVAK